MKKLICIAILSCCLPTAGRAQVKVDDYTFGDGINLRKDDGATLRLDGYIQPYLEMKQSSNADDIYNRFRLRRFRLRLAGNSANERFKYRLQVDLSGTSEADADVSSNNILMDGYVSYDVTGNTTVTFGQRSTPTDNLEMNFNSQTLQFPERSRVTSIFAAIREFGLFVDTSYKIPGTSFYIRPSAAVTNGDGQNVFTKDRGGMKYGGRVNFLPFGTFANMGQYREIDMLRERTPKLLIGGTYSYNVGISDRRGSASGTVLYQDDAGNDAFPDYEKFGADLMFKYRGFTLISEYVKGRAHVADNITRRVRNDGSVTDNFVIDGEQNVANYVKNRVMVGSAFNVQAGYLLPSLWSFDGQYTHIMPEKYSYLNNPAFYDRPNYYTFGVSKFFSRRYAARIQASATYVQAGATATDNNGVLINGHEWIGRIMFSLGF